MLALFLSPAIGFVAASVLSCGLTYLLVRWSVRLKLIAQPRVDRWHGKPTPNTGGLAILTAAVFCDCVFAPGQYRAVVIAATIISLLGFLDDRIELKPLLKFAAQSAAAIALIASGIAFRITAWEWVNFAVTFVWIVGITNAFNLIDNMDGLCAGVAVIICGSRFMFAIQHGDAAGAVLLATLAGATAGFLLFNYSPARIFLGDCGSMFIGFSLAALAAAAPAPRTRVFAATLFYPTLTFLYPIFDTALVSILRRSAGRPISVGGRDHSSHRLVSLGLGERKAVLLLWTLSAAGAGLGLLTYALPLDVLALAILMIAGVTVFGVFLGTLPAYAPPDTAPVRLTWIRSYIPSLRAGITLVIDVLLAGVALLTAFLIRWDNTFVDAHAQQFRLSFPIIIGSQMLASIALRTFDSGWRWFGARDLFALVRCALLGPATSMFALWFAGVRDYSRGVILLYAFFVLAFTAGLRLSMRLLWQTLGKPPASRRAAVLGATGATEIAVLVLQRSRSMKIAPVGVVDPDPACDRMRMHGIAVHYAGEDLVRLLRHIRADVLVVPAGEALSDGHRRILEQCRAAGVSIEQLDVAMSTWTEDSDEASVDAHAIA